MPPLAGWQAYQLQVGEIAADLLRSVADVGAPIAVGVEVDLAGRNAPHRVDVLARAGDVALFIECKHYRRPLNKNQLSTTLYNFLDVCLGNPGQRWALAVVAPIEIPDRARLPASRASGIYVSVPNLLEATLARSARFFYFNPPADPDAAVPFFSDDGRVGIAGEGGAVAVAELWERLNDPSMSLPGRVDAGLRLAARDPEILARNYAAGRTVIHGLVHLGRTQEAVWVREVVDRGQIRPIGAAIEKLMMDFSLAQQRPSRSRRPGAKSIQQMRRLIGTVPLVDDVSIRDFIGPVIARWGEEDEGLALLGGVEGRVPGLEFAAAPYFELLRLVRTAQVSNFATERAELIERAEEVSLELPLWNRVIGEALIDAVRDDSRLLHGIDVPFDVETWTEGGAAWARAESGSVS